VRRRIIQRYTETADIDSVIAIITED